MHSDFVQIQEIRNEKAHAVVVRHLNLLITFQVCILLKTTHTKYCPRMQLF